MRSAERKKVGRRARTCQSKLSQDEGERLKDIVGSWIPSVESGNSNDGCSTADIACDSDAVSGKYQGPETPPVRSLASTWKEMGAREEGREGGRRRRV